MAPTRPAFPAADFTLRGVHVMNASGEFEGPTDVAATGGQIAGIGANLPLIASAADIDLAGVWMMPGVVDTHLHAVTRSFDGGEHLSTPYSYRITHARWPSTPGHPPGVAVGEPDRRPHSPSRRRPPADLQEVETHA